MEGGCMCGKLRYSVSGEPSFKAICHCLDCRKVTGSTFSTNVVYPEDQFKVTSGTAKEFSKIADSGKKVSRFFCGDCGSTIWDLSANFKSSVVLNAGTLDDKDALNKAKPQAEVFTRSRVDWLTEIPGAEQKQLM
ncbi:DUF636 domain protein [Delitschia confertaspora ATCC 74209]|uniref:DUF636 domain protein n=1 Tax=Delitschia confertaspora ATCC 74209 TaxID=1513339 RepID=A0A9P4JD68_9PLEO|nr:DUF636 domain protein [Delitschia confertaspora ATCC 74209]